ncbi:MAG: agmatine deiminase family protein [Pirellulaceae bacterium]
MNDAATPRQLGYRWPAEWEPHAATWLSWPHNRESWPEKFEPVPEQFAELVRTLARYEVVNVLAGGEEAMREAHRLVGDLTRVVLWDVPTNDAWCRDHGPTFLLAANSDQPAVMVDWEYNAWGGKYPPFNSDNLVPRRINDRLARRRFAPGVVLEGGSIEGNGRGLILTTESCLLDPRRNLDATRERMENVLREFCCAQKVLWLTGGAIAGDDTDGHVDQIARFVAHDTVVAAVESDPADENFTPLLQNLRELERMTDEKDRPLKIVPLPMPRPIVFNQQRLPGSYANFYIANGVVVVPQFDDPADEVALQTLTPLFPGRQVVGLPARDLVLGLGAFHCLTQQEPAPARSADIAE